jgi:hypothetical protein
MSSDTYGQQELNLQWQNTTGNTSELLADIEFWHYEFVLL